VAEGATTGLGSVVTCAFFLLAIILAPIAGIVPAEATAPALIIVGSLMASELKDISFGRVEDGLPALLTIAVMPFTYSITNGIGAGFILYTFLRVVTGKAAQVPWLMYLVSAAFVIYFAMPFLEATFGL
jgi:AGZA family xanthine/uracil permease-like MFS transporter